MKKTINWFEIYTEDLDRAKQFYTTVFKCELTDLPVDSERHMNMKYAIFPTEGALVKMDEAKPGYGGTLIYFATEEINAELSRVEAAGGKILRPKLQVGDFGFIALIEDSEGNLIGLHSTK